MDALDELCKAWSQCRSCTSIDDATCDPNEKPYEVGFDPATMRIDCQFNPDVCTVNNCKCDEELAYKLTANIRKMKNKYVTHSDGSGFNHAWCQAVTTAPSTGTTATTTRGTATTTASYFGGNGATSAPSVQCCGNYPKRKTYNTGRQDCCPGRYNSYVTSIGQC